MKTGDEQRLKNDIQTAANKILKEGLCLTTDGLWKLEWDELGRYLDGTVSLNNRTGQLLLEELRQKKEVAELIATEDCIEMTYHLEYCPQCQGGGVHGVMSLISLMGCNLENVHLVHDEEEHDLATVVELNQNTLTPEGKKEWVDVLAASVKRIYNGSYGTQIELSGCSPQRLCDFSYMLAGYCLSGQYEKWMTDGKKKLEDDYKNSKAISLIVAYEEIYGVPLDQQITYYFGDYGAHVIKHAVTDEQIKAAYNKALEAIRMDSPTFQSTDAFLNRQEIFNRMRSCILSQELKKGMRVFFVPTRPLIGADGFRIGGARVEAIHPERLTCTVSSIETDGSMEIPLHHVVAEYDPEQANRRFGIKHARPRCIP